MLLIAIIAAATVVSALGARQPTTAQKESAYTEELTRRSINELGMPVITNFYEKRLAKRIFEARDNSKLICHVYNQAMNGKLVYIGKSKGYGLPYSTQYTAPTKDKCYSSGATETTCQADPNGLYTADGLSATWLLMINEEDGSEYIMYVEPTIIVSEKKMPKRLIEKWSLPENY